MIGLRLAGLTAIVAGLLAGPAAVAREGVTRLVGEDQVIMRVPVQPRAPVRQVLWVERKGPRCIAAENIGRALLMSGDEVDFVMVGKRRFRAKFDDDCPGLDFYGGFYLETEDDMVCAGRDAIRSRMGGRCRIDHFTQLQPMVRKVVPRR